MRKVLVSTLGDTPPVVTEALDKLHDDGGNIDEVMLFHTKDIDARDSAELLMTHIPQYYPSTIAYDIVTEAYADIDSESAVIDFMRQVCKQLRDLRKQDCEVYVSIAGGRKSMSALMTLAVQFYGATQLFHILVDDIEVEEQGKISALRLHPERDRVLHPPTTQVRLVQLPFVGLFPWLPGLLNGLRGHQVLRETQTLLETNGLMTRDGTSTPTGSFVREILEDVETLPEPCQHPLEVHISSGEPRHRDQLNRLINKLRPLTWICKMQSIPWRRGTQKAIVKEIGVIEVYEPTGGPAIGLRLETTARTQAQTERIRKEVERQLGW
jgi:CRISPR-associated protein Csx14